MATGGGARAWLFFRRNDEYGALWRTLAGAAPVFEDAPFPIRRQAQADLAVARFGLLALEDPFAVPGPASPFWSVAPMLEVVPVRLDGWTLAGLARDAGTALAGLRLADGSLIVKLARGGRAQQVRLADGGAFDPMCDSIRAPVDVEPGLPGRHASIERLWRLLRVPGPPTGRGRGPGIASCCKRSTSRGPAGRSPRSPRRCGGRRRSRESGMRTTGSASGCGAASSASSTL